VAFIATVANVKVRLLNSLLNGRRGSAAWCLKEGSKGDVAVYVAYMFMAMN